MRELRIIRVAKKIKKKVVHDFTMKDYKLVIVRIKEISSQLWGNYINTYIFYSFNYVCIIDSLDQFIFLYSNFNFWIVVKKRNVNDISYSSNFFFSPIISINSGWMMILSIKKKKKKKRQIRISFSFSNLNNILFFFFRLYIYVFF